MSNKDSKPVNENYPTPRWVVRRLLEVWTPPKGVAMDPAVGEGAIIKSIHDSYKWKITEWVTCDIRDVPKMAWASAGVPVDHHHCDYLRTPLEVSDVSLVTTNPPFSLADNFIRKARLECPKAELVFLLRLGFLASEERAVLWYDVGEPDVWVLPNRPSYVSKKPGRLDTDKYDYGWFIWPPHSDKLHDHGEGSRTRGTIGHLKLTTLEERKRG
jgi:hypothetical protein